MAWYTASVIIALESDVDFTAFENVLLVEAASFDDARVKSASMGREEAYDDPTLRLNDRPAKWRYVGIRKVTEITDLQASNADDQMPRHGAEVSYSRFDLKDKGDLEKLAAGKEVEVRYLE